MLVCVSFARLCEDLCRYLVIAPGSQRNLFPLLYQLRESLDCRQILTQPEMNEA